MPGELAVLVCLYGSRVKQHASSSLREGMSSPGVTFLAVRASRFNQQSQFWRGM